MRASVLRPWQPLDATFHDVSNGQHDVAVQFRNGWVFTDVFNLCNTDVYVIGRGPAGGMASRRRSG